MFSFFRNRQKRDNQQQAGDGMWLLVGLGNPGDKYKNNRHNIGFMAVDAIADDHHFPTFRSKFQGEFCEGRLSNQKIILLKPMTYMNNSGQSVKAAAKFFKINPDRIVVFHDELDLEGGKIRAKRGGGNAGHNGLKSIQAHLGTPDFWRIRLGIGHPGDKARVHGHVLSDFSKTEQQWTEPLLQAIAKHIELLADDKQSAFVSKVGSDVGPVKRDKAESNSE